jgi:hypothetical protein
MSIPADKQSLNSLTQNSKDAMAELEGVFPAMMKMREHLTAIENEAANIDGSILALFSKTEDLYIGSHFIIHELMSSLRLLLDTDIVYEKQYHVQNINLTLCEAYKYFVGVKKDGVWPLLKPMISALDNHILQSYKTIIDVELTKLGAEYCDKQMRNSTAHYDEPIKRYNQLLKITDEDKYCKAISQFMLIYLRISQISTIIFAIISQIMPKSTAQNIEQKMPMFDVKAFVENDIAEKLSSDERIRKLSKESLTNRNNNIDSLYNDYLKYENTKKFILTRNLQIPQSIEILCQLVLLRMMTSFVRCDITCAMRAYINSKSSVERSLHLRKIYMTEVSALTHLYGYNQDKKRKSLWHQLINIDTTYDEKELSPLRENFEELTAHLNRTRRNLYTHFRENDNLNVLKRYNAYRELNQVAEINEALKLLHLCEKIDNYTMSVLKRIGEEIEQKSKEQKNSRYAMFENMRTMTRYSRSSETMKAQTLTMLNEMEKKLADLFDWKKK